MQSLQSFNLCLSWRQFFVWPSTESQNSGVRQDDHYFIIWNSKCRTLIDCVSLVEPNDVSKRGKTDGKVPAGTLLDDTTGRLEIDDREIVIASQRKVFISFLLPTRNSTLTHSLIPQMDDK